MSGRNFLYTVMHHVHDSVIMYLLKICFSRINPTNLNGCG